MVPETGSPVRLHMNVLAVKQSCTGSNIRCDLLSISWKLAQLNGLISISSVLITGEAGLRRTVICADP